MAGHTHHQHHHNHNHEDFDPGSMYEKEWVQKLVRELQDFLQQNMTWLGVDPRKKQRVLDYACGHGTVSLAFLSQCSSSTFQGIDSHPKQVERFNNEAAQAASEASERMFAIQGDLENPSDELKDQKWYDFDTAIISMALHHVKDPIAMLSSLRERVKKGGTLIVIEWASEAEFQANGKNHQSAAASDDNKPPNNVYDTEKMIEVIGGQKIWPGFSPESLESAMVEAGCSKVEIKHHSETFEIPEEVGHGGHKRLLFAKGLVS